MIKEFLESYAFSSLVVNKSVLNRLSEKDYGYIMDQNPIVVTDARSSAFRAFGIAKETCSNKVVLLLDGTAAENIYTAVTEMFFQEIPVLILPVFFAGETFDFDYMRRCSNVLSPLTENEKITDFSLLVDQFKPTVLPVVISDSLSATNDYSVIFKALSHVLNKDDIVFSYHSGSAEDYPFEVRNIKQKYKYGVLSKYMGFVTVSDKRCLLCITPEILELDINIFNNRYVSDKVRIIVYGTDNYERMKKWLVSNGFEVNLADINTFDSHFCKTLLSNESPTILFIERDKN